MLDKGLLGEKAGHGFYERRKNASGESEIWTLDLETLEYRPRKSARIRVDRSRQDHRQRRERVRMLFNAQDKAGEFLRETLAPTLIYTARVTPDIAYRSTTSIA